MLDAFERILASGEMGMLVPGAFLFMAVAAVTFAVGQMVQSRGMIRRRATDVGSIDIDVTRPDPRSPQDVGRAKAGRLLDRVSRNFVPEDARQLAKLKRQLMQAGFLQPAAVTWFFVARFFCLGGFAGGAMVGLGAAGIAGQTLWTLAAVAGLIGYALPSAFLSRRAAANRLEHRIGFPDFMDLMVVCADAGLSMEAALDRVGRELIQTYPSLAANMAMTTLEMRAGRSLGEALDHLGDRLGIPEARSFATLLQQSEELGSSMTEALRVYSEDMRHQRLSRAEEKAYALPAKLVIPLGLCVFPVLIAVTVLPIVIRLKGYGP